ncbi:MAG: M48 family metalloprotease [Candidatus Gastranaerophilales bacterium]|nr:M48 family metalloprotease [Candidatus Gastranaerophilales bacterium]
MKKLSWITVLLFLFCFFNVGCSFAATKKNVQQQKTSIIKYIDLESEFYKRAEIKLDRQLYREYRVAERIIRANKLDNYPWVIEIPNSRDYVVNASTKQGNLITIECGIINTFYDDVSALAFVTAHEMAHEILRHLYKQNRYDQVLNKNYQNDVNSTIENLPDLINKYIILAPVIGSSGTYNLAQVRVEQEKKALENKRIENDYDKLAFSRKCEYEADKLGLIMIIKAGFLADSSVKFFEFLKRMPDTLEEDSTHPSDENRIWQIQTTIKNINIEQLKKEGQNNINHSKPLTYEKSFYKERDTLRKKTIVINSKYATEEVNEPFKKMFGK